MEFEVGDEVDDFGDGSGYEEGVGGGGDNGSDLLVENDEVVIEEVILGIGVDIIEIDDSVGGEESVEDEIDNVIDIVFSEDIEGVVDVDEEFDYRMCQYDEY